MSNIKPVIILVAGGSASGKTTVVEKIIKKTNHKDVIIIKHDDYYKDQAELSLEQRSKVNYDHPDSLDNELLYTHLNDLLNNRSIFMPQYDFINSTRSNKTIKTEPKPVIIVEGILVLTDPRIRDLADIKIFVESDDDIRFIRRLKRDLIERGRSLDSIINQYLTTVKPMHYAFVKPTKRDADIIIPNDKKHDVAVDVIVGKIKQISEERK